MDQLNLDTENYPCDWSLLDEHESNYTDSWVPPFNLTANSKSTNNSPLFFQTIGTAEEGPSHAHEKKRKIMVVTPKISQQERNRLSAEVTRAKKRLELRTLTELNNQLVEKNKRIKSRFITQDAIQFERDTFPVVFPVDICLDPALCHGPQWESVPQRHQEFKRRDEELKNKTDLSASDKKEHRKIKNKISAAKSRHNFFKKINKLILENEALEQENVSLEAIYSAKI